MGLLGEAVVKVGVAQLIVIRRDEKCEMRGGDKGSSSQSMGQMEVHAII